jgi:hypothetical protein
VLDSSGFLAKSEIIECPVKVVHCEHTGTNGVLGTEAERRAREQGGDPGRLSLP